MPPILQVFAFSTPSRRRPGVGYATFGILAYCLIAVPTAPPQALAQETSESGYAGPVEPTDWKLSDWPRHRLRYTTALQADRLNTEQREQLTRGIEYYLYSMTSAVPGDPIIELRRRLTTELRTPITTNAARQHMLEEIVRIAEQLLDQPPGVRLNIMILLASLSTNPTPAPPIPYEPASDIMLTVLNDPAQPVQCKIWAANGLGRISRYGNPNITLKSRIAVDLVKALESPEAQQTNNWWYRMRLVDALGNNEERVNINQEPVVIDKLIAMIYDPQEHWVIRASAARAITQLKWDSQTNAPLINWVIGQLGHQMAEAYNQHLARNANQEAPYWRGCFINCYRAYQPQSADEKQRGWGLLQKAGAQNQNEVQAAYGVMLPVVNAVTRDTAAQQIPQAAIDALGGWLGGNAPDNWKVTPRSSELKKPGSPPETPASSLGPGRTDGSDTEDAGAIAGATRQ